MLRFVVLFKRVMLIASTCKSGSRVVKTATKIGISVQINTFKPATPLMCFSVHIFVQVRTIFYINHIDIRNLSVSRQKQNVSPKCNLNKYKSEVEFKTLTKHCFYSIVWKWQKVKWFLKPFWMKSWSLSLLKGYFLALAEPSKGYKRY